MKESEYIANLELARGAQRRAHVRVYQPAKRENRALAVVLVIVCGMSIGVMLALGI